MTKPRRIDLKDMTRQARYVERNKMRGRCVWCPKPVAPGRRLCKDHLKRDAERRAVALAKLVAEGRCVYCGCSVKPPFKSCARDACIPSRRKN
jgi:hypothetical protein